MNQCHTSIAILGCVLAGLTSGQTGTTTTVAGNGVSGFSGDGGPAISAALASPTSVAWDGSGNLYIADSTHSVIRKLVTSNGTITTVAGNGVSGFSGDGGLATNAELGNPSGVAVDAAGNLYIADMANSRIRKVSAVTGTITRVAGTGCAYTGYVQVSCYTGDGGPATSATIRNPLSVAVDGAGNLYTADAGNNVVRKVAAASGIIATFAGNGTMGFAGDGAAAISAEFSEPQGLAVGSNGNLYIADQGNNRIRMVDAGTGIITTVVGNSCVSVGATFNKFGCYAGDGGLATSASLNLPMGVAIDSGGNLYIADTNNNVIRKVSVAGIITTIAGQRFSDDTTSALLNQPASVAVDSAGNLYIADTGNNRILEEVFGTNPVITSLSQYTAPAGGGPLSLTILGDNFVAGSTVHWNGSAVATNFVSETQLTPRYRRI